MTRATLSLTPWLALTFCLSPAAAQVDDFTDDEFPARPKPAWVEIFDQGEQDPKLSGMWTPRGIKVEVVAAEPTVLNPVGMDFADDGSLYVLYWKPATEQKLIDYEVTFRDGSKATIDRMWKDVKDELHILRDTDGDGRYDRREVAMDDLEIPSGLLLHDSWIYLSSIGHIIRRRPYDEALLKELQAAAEAKKGPPSIRTADGRWIEQEIVRGLCGFHQHQVSGLAIGPDGWLNVSSGDDDNRPEGWDGSRAVVLRTGAIFRMRPDGSQVSEFARGLRNPYGDVAFDQLGNIFHSDNDQEDGSKFQGVRLLHVVEGGDYGWRLYPGTVCCRPDLTRGVVWGERPGTLPGLLKTGRGAPCGLFIYNGTYFPEFFRGLVIYPDVYRKLVRAYAVERDGATFKVTAEFELMRSEDGLFRPCQAIQGPDGAIYIADWRTDSGGAGALTGDNQHGRIYQLSWSGTNVAPAIPLGSLDSWSKFATAEEGELWPLMESADYEIRRRATQEIVRRAGRENVTKGETAARLRNRALNPDAPPWSQAAALSALAQLRAESLTEVALALLEAPNEELQRLAAVALGDQLPAKREAQEQLADTLQGILLHKSPAVQRALYLALGKLGTRLETVPEWIFEAMSNTLTDQTPRHVFDAHVRAAEMPPGSATDLLLGNLEVALFDPNADAMERVRIKRFVVATAEAMRTRELATFLDRTIKDDQDYFSKLEAPLEARLLASYKNVQVEPPINADAVAQWLEKHPQADLEVQVVALETLGIVGTTKAEALREHAVRLLGHEEEQARLRVIAAIGNAGLSGASKPLAAVLRDGKRSIAERRAALQALAKLRSRPAAFSGKPSPPGVELVVDDVLAVAQDETAPELRGDALRLVGQVKYDLARPLAEKLLATSDLALATAAVNVLAARADDAQAVARQYVSGKLDRSLLPHVAEGLRRHAEKDASGQVTGLLKEVFKGGLLVSLEPAEITRVERMVRTTGNAERGRGVYLDKRVQCANCHKLEGTKIGTGGQVGPDLSKIYETHTVAKLIESLVEPSKEIKEGFVTYSARTKDGLVHTGLKAEDAGGMVVLREASGKDVRIPKTELDLLQPTKTSLMPDNVLALLSYDEFIDLVAFLKSKEAQAALRKP